MPVTPSPTAGNTVRLVTELRHNFYEVLPDPSSVPGGVDKGEEAAAAVADRALREIGLAADAATVDVAAVIALDDPTVD